MTLTKESEAFAQDIWDRSDDIGFTLDEARERIAAIEAAARESAQAERDRLVAALEAIANLDPMLPIWSTDAKRIARAALAPPDTAVEHG